MPPEEIIFLGLVFYAVGYYSYLRDMFLGNTKPNLVSWFIWMLAPLIATFFALKAGAGLSVIPVFAGGVGPMIVLSVSLLRKNVSWKITQIDLICGAMSLLALSLYVTTHNLSISIVFAILSDALAFIPTFRKSWSHPESETGLLYMASAVVNITGVFVIKNWSFPIYSFGTYLIIANIVQLSIMYRKKIFKTVQDVKIDN